MTTPLTCQRDLFAIPPGETYLNAAYMGPMPRAVLAAGERALAARAMPASIVPRDFFEPAERTRAPCARRRGQATEGAYLVTA